MSHRHECSGGICKLTQARAEGEAAGERRGLEKAALVAAAWKPDGLPVHGIGQRIAASIRTLAGSAKAEPCRGCGKTPCGETEFPDPDHFAEPAQPQPDRFACGPCQAIGVAVDVDGCCSTCGSDAVPVDASGRVSFASAQPQPDVAKALEILGPLAGAPRGTVASEYGQAITEAIAALRGAR